MNILSTYYIVFFRYILHNSECPATVFSILEANGKTVTLTSDTLFDLLMLKLTNVYTPTLRGQQLERLPATKLPRPLHHDTGVQKNHTIPPEYGTERLQPPI